MPILASSHYKSSSLLLAAVFAAALAPQLRATTVSSIWTGGTSANWSDATNWSPSAAAPGNGNAGVSDYNVTINPVSTPNFAPTLDVSENIDSLVLTPTASLAIGSGLTLNTFAPILNNQGTITLQGNPTLNAASLNASSGAITLNGGGTIILTNAAFSRLSGGPWTNVDNTIRGIGTITATLINQGTIRPEGGTLTLNATVDNTAGTIDIAANGILNAQALITGGTVHGVPGATINGSFNNITNNGSLTVSTAAAFTVQNTFTNQGTVNVLGDPTNSIAQLNSSGNVTLTGGGTIVLTNAAFSRIGGSGTWTNVNNVIRGQGTFTAPGLINRGTIRPEGGTITLNANVDNTAGSIILAADGNLTTGATITGGILNTFSTSNVGGTFNSVTSTGALTVGTANVFTVQSSFSNQGNVTILGDPTNSIAQFNSSGNVTLTGGGTVFLTNATFSRIGGSGTWTNFDNTIRGQGTITAPLINQHTIIAEGGTLTLSNSVDNSAGAINVAANGILLNNAPLTGGSIVLTSGAKIGGSGSINSVTLSGIGTLIGSNIFSNITLASLGQLGIQAGASPAFAGTFTNHGNVTVLGDPTNSIAQFNSSGNVTLTGGGTVFLTNPTFSRIGGSGTWTNVDNIIRGQGTITAPFINQHSIIAEGGSLSLSASVDNTAGTVTVAADGTLILNATLVGGTLNTQTTSTVTGTMQNITTNGNLTVGTTGPVNFLDTLTNTGTITVLGDPTHSIAQLTANNAVTLTGGGTVVLTNSTFSRINGGGTWTNLDNTIRGQGTITSALINKHDIIAEGGAINLSVPLDNTAGTFTVAADGALNANSPLSGGILNTQASSVISGTLSNLTTNGPISINPSNSVVLTNTINNLSTITIFGDPVHSVAQLSINSPVTLTGNGSIVLTNTTFSHISGGGNLTTTNTISGTGIIGLGSLQTSGSILSNTGNITINAPVSLTGASLGGTGFLTINDPLSLGGSVILLGDAKTGPLTLAGTANAWTAHLDVTTAKLNIEDSTVNHAADAVLLRNAVFYGLTHSTGISSSTIPSNKALAISDNAIAHDTHFEGSTDIDSNSILMAVAFKGDFNLDGVVDISDLTTVANHWQQSVSDWSQGDFDYNNIVDILDLTAVANNWQAGVGSGGQSFSEALATLPAFAPVAAAPEPASLALLGLAVSLLLTKKRRPFQID